MWEVRVNSSDSADFPCGKCTQLQLLKDRVRELELDEHRIIQEAEVVIEMSYRDRVTPKNEGSWVTVKERKQGSPVVVPLNNKYAVLDTAGEGGGVVGPTR
eukprot:g14545.t1